MRPACVDLHVHSTASDGSDRPSEVVVRAFRAGLKAVALTDHDTLSGLEEAETMADSLEIEFIRGCEISTATQFGEAHFLGLWLPRGKQAAGLEQVLENVRIERRARNMRICEKLCALGYEITYDEIVELAGGDVVGRPHFAEMLVRIGAVKDRKEAFRRFLAEGAAAYEPRVLMSPEEAVRLLRESGALVAMAHPRLLKASVRELSDMIGPLKDAGLDALEAYHSEHNAGDVRECVELAARFGLQLTGGSDYHGTPKPGIEIGSGKGGLRVTWGLYERLLDYRKNRLHA